MDKIFSKRALAVFIIFAITVAIFPFTKVKAAQTQTVAVVVDYDNCLTEAQEEELIKSLTVAANSAGCSIGIVITSDLGGLSDKEYADKFSDDNFGAGSDAVVLLLLNSYDKPEHASHTDRISTSGKMINKLDGYYDKIFDAIYKKMGDFKGDPFAFNEETGTYGGYDYYAACEAFADSIVVYAGKFELHDCDDPGFSVGVTSTETSAFAGWISELVRGIFRMLGGLKVGC